MSGTDKRHGSGDATPPVRLTERQLWALATGRQVTVSLGGEPGERSEVTVRPPDPPEPLESPERPELPATTGGD